MKLMRKYSLSIDICRTINIKVEDVFTENDEILYKIINQVCMLNKILSFWNWTQVWPKADCNVVRVHLGVFALKKYLKFPQQKLDIYSLYLYCERSLRKAKR